MKNQILPFWIRSVATLLLPIMFLMSFPAPVYAALEQESRKIKVKIPHDSTKVNRTVAKFSKPAEKHSFTKNPTDQELILKKVLNFALIPTSKKNPSPLENQKLGASLSKCLQGSCQRKTVAEFLNKNPHSRWELSLLVNLAEISYQEGFFSDALRYWEQAWGIGKEETEPSLTAMADYALGQLLKMNARIGRMEVMEALLKNNSKRRMIGSGAEWYSLSTGALQVMQKRPEIAFMCGPYSLLSICHQTGEGDSRPILSAKSPQTGFSLNQVDDFSQKAKLPYRMMKRTGNVPIPLPAVVHWKLNHYGALLAENGDRYLLKDPTFGNEHWILKSAVDQESSGYFLIDPKKSSNAWKAVSQNEAKTIFGKGYTNGPDPDDPKGDDCKSCKSCGMPEYSYEKMTCSLTITDTPVVYSPTFGPVPYFQLTYQQRENTQDPVFTHSNFGFRWSFNLISYIRDNPAVEGNPVKLILSSGGAYTFANPNNSGEYNICSNTTSRLVRLSPNSYELRSIDGSKEVFSQPDGSIGFGRKVFLTQKIDPQGNSLSYFYDAQYRLVGVQDAMGQVTSFSYENSEDLLKITKITDPFGRTAIFTYENGLLKSITDAISLTSSFEYEGDFIKSMTTPYGKTAFEKNEGEGSRSLVIRTQSVTKKRFSHLLQELLIRPTLMRVIILESRPF